MSRINGKKHTKHWCPCMAINGSVQHNGGFLPGIILLTQDYYRQENTQNTGTQGGRPGSSEVPRNLLTRWDVSSIPANGIFLNKKLKNKNKNAQRVEND